MIATARRTVGGNAPYGCSVLHMEGLPYIWMILWTEMDLARPYAALCPTLDAGVLSVLAGTTRPLTGREVSRLLGRRSHSGVLDTLDRLTEHGLVDREEAGRAFLFTLNREHLVAPAVDLLAQLRGELFERLAQLVDSWKIAAIHVSSVRFDGPGRRRYEQRHRPLRGTTGGGGARGAAVAGDNSTCWLAKSSAGPGTWPESLRWVKRRSRACSKRIRRSWPTFARTRSPLPEPKRRRYWAGADGRSRRNAHPALFRRGFANAFGPRPQVPRGRRDDRRRGWRRGVRQCRDRACGAGRDCRCATLGRRSRGQDHQQATGLVEQVEPGGIKAAKALRRLLSLKDEAHYGLFDVSGQDLQAALRQAKALVDFAARAIQRRPA